MKASASDIRAALAKPRPDIRLYLLFGPDESGSAKLARALADGFGADCERIDLTGAKLREDPSLLADEAASLSLFGTARYIRVTTQGEEALAATENLLAADHAINPVVMIASGISDKARIAKLATAAKNALACQSMPPRPEAMADLVAAMARDAGLVMDHDIAFRIGAYTGNDQRLAQMEIDKLALYCDADPEQPRHVNWDMVAALGASAEDDTMQPVIHAALGGDLPRLRIELRRMQEQGISEVGLVIVMQRHVMQLAGLAAKLGPRGDIDGLVENESRARRLFGDRNAFKRQLRRWPQPALARLVERLIDLQQRMMRTSPGAALQLRQELLEIARVASQRG